MFALLCSVLSVFFLTVYAENQDVACFRKFNSADGLCYGYLDYASFSNYKHCCTQGEGFAVSLLPIGRGGYSCSACPISVDGGWGGWQPWTPCSLTCGDGVRFRIRNCNNPVPRNGGKTCPFSDAVQMERCSPIPCPVNGDWSPWGGYSACSTTCGKGIRKRHRQCDNPLPSFGGKPCQGSSEGSVECFLSPCPIDGNWSKWSPWSECSASCGNGIRQRFRVCDSPPPQFSGKECSGNRDSVEDCKADIECKINGGWSSWGSWGHCFATNCGVNNETGYQYRSRVCDQPRPKYSGLMCQGSFIAGGICFDPVNCPANGQWSQWSKWECSESSIRRTRKCDNPPPRHGGKECRNDGYMDIISEEEDPDSYRAVCGAKNKKNDKANFIEGSGSGDGSLETMCDQSFDCD